MRVVFLVFLVSVQAHAFRDQFMNGNDSGAAAVYTLDENGGTTAFDTGNLVNPLDLNLSTSGNLPTGDGTTIRTNATFLPQYLLMNPKPNGSMSGMADQGYQSAQRHRTFLVSSGAATNLNSCTNGFTIQAFLRPWFPFQGSDSGNLILGLSNSDGASTVQVPNIGLYQSGMAGAESIELEVRTGNNRGTRIASQPNAFYSVREGENVGAVTEVIATQESTNGVLTVYVNRIARSTLTGVTPAFLSTARLVVGNELVPLTVQNGETDIDQQRNWSGEIYHIAIYCRGFTRAEILGPMVDNKNKQEVVSPASNQIDTYREQARRLVERLTGIVIPIDHPMILRVRDRLAAQDSIGAAKIVTGDLTASEPGHPDFLNTMVKQMAMKMSNREETIRAPLNDFAAAFIGVTRDERNAQELLTSDFYYMADPAKAAVRNNFFRDLLVTNNHYEDLERGQWDLGKILVRVPSSEAPASAPRGQQIATSESGSFTPNPDPAGVLTSRAFMAAHAIAGTNRRMIEYTFREFMCIPMIEIADTSASPARIGRDVDRIPGGDQTKFETSCKGCHTIMDGYRGAFAHFDFASTTINNVNYNFIRNTLVNNGSDFGFPDNTRDANGTVYKMNHNNNVFPNGYVIVDDSFVNNAVGNKNKDVFGWVGSNRLGGVGAAQFGRMLADSERFPQCMAKRVFDSVCAPDIKSDSRMNPTIIELANKFKSSGYNFRTLFQEAAVHPDCTSLMGR